MLKKLILSLVVFVITSVILLGGLFNYIYTLSEPTEPHSDNSVLSTYIDMGDSMRQLLNQNLLSEEALIQWPSENIDIQLAYSIVSAEHSAS